MLTRVGWEAPQSWPVPRPDGRGLVFQTRLPAARFVPAADLPERDRDALASLGGELIGLGEAAAAPGIFLAAAICSTEGEHGVLATMTAALGPRPLPFTRADGAVIRGRRGRRRVKGMPAPVTVAERRDGDLPGSPLIVQYAIVQRAGTVSLTFVTDGPGLAGNARRLFQNVARGCCLGAEPPA